MSITKQQAKQFLQRDAFGELFIALGWDAPQSQPLPIKLDERILTATVVAEKRGFAVLVVRTKEPLTKPERHKVERKVARSYFEHLVIFHAESGQQLWQLAIRRPNQPITFHETPWHKGQEPELLYQKLSGLFIPLAEEDKITLVDVRERVTREFEKQTKDVTKKFYAGFKQQHDQFLKFIEGLNDQDAKKWYASLMLNRLMFIYFMQRKGFMDGKKDYLGLKLKETEMAEGKDKFYGFYRNFLRVLFHQGLGDPKRTPELETRIGKVPYLNGGLFDEHDLEKDNTEIQIKDEAFKKLFAFFDEWQWTLDTRQHASGREVNPDVIGYIFEQYINDRAQMGAYYTKEDITEYIAKNTIIPWLFDAAKAKDAQAFKPEGGVWELLRNDPDRYIHASVKHGVDPALMEKDDAKSPWHKSPIFSDLDKELRAGLSPDQKDLVAKRKCWNRTADADKALPTEIWREVIERRRRYLEVRRKLVAGEVTAINDLITYNLDIRQFAQDVLHEHESGDLVWAFYDAIQHVTVLDPTCGSGAFLFAALGILQPLYEECLQRMAEFREQAKNEGKPKRWQQFQPILDRIAKHHDDNRAYFIYKSIILQNLYGVDIMPEAVEIAKLRLFLKLVSTVEPQPNHPNGSYGIEPLPDIDFNIRAGNTLVGFATRANVEAITKQTFDFGEKERGKIEEESEALDQVYDRWKETQLKHGASSAGEPEDLHELKKQLLKRTAVVNEKLNQYLSKWYQITDVKKQHDQYEQWKQSHRPFHWFAEFYGIMNKRGGFDVIIGNPPYVGFDKKTGYKVVGYDTVDCGNLYPLVMERSSALSAGGRARVGMIVMLNLVFADGYGSLRKHITKRSKNVWLSSYDNIPDGLFAGSPKEHSKNTNKVVSQRVSVVLYDSEQDSKATIHASHFLRWNREFRNTLFEVLSYGTYQTEGKAQWPALGSSLAVAADLRMRTAKAQALGGLLYDKGSQFLQLAATPRYFITAVPEPLNRSGLIEIRFPDAGNRKVAECALNSTLFYWYWRAKGDGFHLTRGSIDSFPVPMSLGGDIKGVQRTVDMLTKARDKCRTSKLNKGQVVHNVNYNIVPEVMPEIDTLLALHYGLSAEELDFVINYDIKYRMGEELEGEE